ncbi:SERAC1 [Verticillium alfalfae VaMs.102]|uniref:SERAC1 n=1 Tax=Verticillium alfalfae (strain VaMs.102 / ATCC MYA-4576 / FGSC 10136) TaxID=526221 RepID=C9SH27_VERA1|nr:SERAC1 [Verticillium alfalfae VaMs.102]EEY17621.1 SERAC1 [Verticillium alfalfae VaMs.102]
MSPSPEDDTAIKFNLPQSSANVEVASEGFTTLWSALEAETDIVFIHGLQGHAQKTWHYGAVEESGRGLLRIFQSSQRQHRKHDCFWPRDLLPNDCPNSRILTYGYDSHVSHFFSGAANQTNVVGHASSFLHELEAIAGTTPDGPSFSLHIVWVVCCSKRPFGKPASSLGFEGAAGGFKMIFESTVATIFLGTPHRGSELAEWGLMLQRAAKAACFDTSDTLLRDLSVDSVTLKTLITGFAGAYERKHWELYTFCEGKALHVPFLPREKVVRDISATLGYHREHVDVINADHRAMCRFRGLHDPGYKKVRNALKACMRNQPGSIDGIKFRKALRELDAEETRWRLQQVVPAFEDTFEWLYANKQLRFVDWLGSDEGLYWIKGKPASGKSTLLKKAYTDTRTQKAQVALRAKGFKCTTAAFFFHDRGSPLQKSFEGFLKAVLHQILKDIPELRSVVHEGWRYFYRKSEPFTWTTDKLIHVFEHVVRETNFNTSILLFVDALDEFEGFWIQDHTAGDIQRVVDVEFQSNSRVGRELRDGTAIQKAAIDSLKGQITRMAEGVFLWVRLILEELLGDFTDGSSVEEVAEELTRLPTDLTRYYQYLLEKRIRQKYIRQSRVMLDIVKCAKRPLVLSDFLLAYRFAAKSDSEVPGSRFAKVDTSFDEAKRLIQSRCGGLVELKEVRLESTERIYACPAFSDDQLEDYHVQFLHQTVKAFVEKASSAFTDSEDETPVNGFLYLTKLGLLTIGDSAWPRYSPSFSFQNDFLSYLKGSEDAGLTDMSCLLSQVSMAKILDAFNPWATEQYLPPPKNLAGIAMLAETPRFLEHELSLLSGEEASKVFVLFCRYLSKHWETVPKDIASILLRYSTSAQLIMQAVRHSFVDAASKDGVLENQLYLLRMILEKGIHPDTPIPLVVGKVSAGGKSIGWNTFMHTEVSNPLPREVLELLHQHGSDVNARDHKDLTPLDHAVSQFLTAFDTMYSLRGGNVPTARKDAYVRKLDICRFLLDNGGRMTTRSDQFLWDISAETREEITALDIPVEPRLPFPPSMRPGEKFFFGETGHPSGGKEMLEDSASESSEQTEPHDMGWAEYGVQQARSLAWWIVSAGRGGGDEAAQ